MALAWHIDKLRCAALGTPAVDRLSVVNAAKLVFPDHIERPLIAASIVDQAYLADAKTELLSDSLLRLISSDTYSRMSHGIIIHGGDVNFPGALNIDINDIFTEIRKNKDHIKREDGGWVGLESKIRKIIDQSVSARLGGLYALGTLNTAQLVALQKGFDRRLNSVDENLKAIMDKLGIVPAKPKGVKSSIETAQPASEATPGN